MAKDSDQQFHGRDEKDVAIFGPFHKSGGIGRPPYQWTGLFGARSALVVAFALSSMVGCASSGKVAAVNPQRRQPTPRAETSPANEALDRHTGQMAEEDQRRATQGYNRVPARRSRFRDEPIRPSPRP